MRTLCSLLPLVISVAFTFESAGIESYERVPPEIQRRMEESREKILDWLTNVDNDVFQPGKFLARDELLLKDDSRLVGKLLDYGPDVCFIDDTERRVIPRSEIAKILKMSWGDETPKKPDIPDLDVTYIERLPRYMSNHSGVYWDPEEKGIYLSRPNDDPVYPPEGTQATFKGHVMNKGPVKSKPFKYEWLIDGKRKARGAHKAIGPGEEVVIDFKWKWKSGPHTVTLKLIPDGDDFSAWNNSHTDHTDSLGYTICAAQSTYDGFDGVLNTMESFSYEDWVQWHFQIMNFLFMASIHPGSPEGCHERGRIDRMYTFPDDVYMEKYQTAGYENGESYHEGKWGFTPWSNYPVLAVDPGWGLIHELGHQWGIVDYYTLDHWRYHVLARDKNGDIIDIGYSYPTEGMMRGHGPHAYTEVTAIALNSERDQHKGYFGTYLFNLPKECGIRILDYHGNPIPDADLRIFRRAAGVCAGKPAEMRKIFEDPVFEGKTDADGVYMLPNEGPPMNFKFTTDNGYTRNPHPFGDALVLSDTGLLLIEIWKNGQRDIHFTDVTQFAIGRGRGFEDKYIDDIETILPGQDDKLKPPRIVALDTEWAGALRLRWVPDPQSKRAAKFRIYTYTDGLPRTERWRSEIATLNAEGPYAFSCRFPGHALVTMTALDAEGNESAPAEPLFCGWRYFSRIDVNSKNDVFAALEGVVKIDARDKVSLFPTRSWKGFFPANALAIGSDDAFYLLCRGSSEVLVMGPDSAERLRFGGQGSGDGQLSSPNDIDLDTSGNVYIADTENNRIAILGPKGKFIANAGAGKLEKPIVVEADIHGNIYVIEKGKPGLLKITKSADRYDDPVRIVETKKQPSDVTSDSNGRIYLGQHGGPLMVLGQDNKVIATISEWKGKSLMGLSGLVPDKRGHLVCGMGDRGGLIRIPVAELLKNQ